MLTLLADALLGSWVIAVTVFAFGVIPGLAFGRAPGRRSWLPEMLGGCVWSVLVTVIIVPVLALGHLLNWVTAVLVPFVWPAILWLYRSRSAPAAEFRALCRRRTLQLLTAFSPARQPPADDIGQRHAVRRVIGVMAVATTACELSARELRLASPADYDTLAHVRGLFAGGLWIWDPVASVAAIISRIAAVDPMEVLRFLKPLLLPGWLFAAVLQMPPLGAACAWSAVLAAALLTRIALRSVHRRDGWHIVAACGIAALSVLASNLPATAGGHVEYDAAARHTLSIARDAAGNDWVIVAPVEQRVEVGDARRYLSLAEFVRRYADRVGDREFRFELPGHELFVFVERAPLVVPPEAAVTSTRYARDVDAYWRPNARARLERAALDLCERYRRTHAGADVYFEDATLRIYRFVH